MPEHQKQFQVGQQRFARSVSTWVLTLTIVQQPPNDIREPSLSGGQHDDDQGAKDGGDGGA